MPHKTFFSRVVIMRSQNLCVPCNTATMENNLSVSRTNKFLEKLYKDRSVYLLLYKAEYVILSSLFYNRGSS